MQEMRSWFLISPTAKIENQKGITLPKSRKAVAISDCVRPDDTIPRWYDPETDRLNEG